MTSDLSLGLALGATIGVVNALVSYGLWRLARHLPQAGFLKVYFGGMLARLAFALGFVVLAVALVPMHRGAFAGALLVAFVGGLAVETALVLRSAARVSVPRAGHAPASAA